MLGERIKEKRLERGWTQERLGKKIGVGAGTISWWEHNGASPNIYAVWDLADVFGCSIDELCGRKVIEKNERTLLYPKKWDDAYRRK